MAFESLTEKLQNVFKNLRSKGRLTEADVKTALKEVKMALLEADVSFKVVKQFIKSVQEQAVGQDVMNGLNPGQMVIKIVNDELVKLMGSETTEIALRPASEVTIIMMAGLQGAGKTTTTAKIAGKLKAKGRKPLLAACDVYRPAAIKQLQVNGEKQGVEVFAMGDKNRPVDIAKAALVHAKTNGFNVLILDTAGRLHIDEEMMQELQDIKAAVPVDQTLLVVDAMTGQDAVNVSEMFNNKVGIDGVVLTKLDGDTRGGAALSITRSFRQTDSLCRHGRKAFGSGTVLSGPYGVPYSRHGRCDELDRKSTGKHRRRESKSHGTEDEEGTVRLQRLPGFHGADAQYGRHLQHPEYASGRRRENEGPGS